MRPLSKWSDFTHTRITKIYYSRLSMSSCVMTPTIQVIFLFLNVDCFLDRDGRVGGIRYYGVLVLFLMEFSLVVLFKIDHIC